MGNIKTDIEAFVSAFNADPGGRAELVNGLVASEGRLLINLPGRSAARLIAERLREGPFSVLYDFEMILARRLHPRLADLKLNIFADITVNALFDERYRPYAADAAAALAKSGGMSRLRGIITRMVNREGHRMSLKFCDLVLRWADPGLYRTLRPVEACIMSMKDGGNAGAPLAFDRVSALYEEFAAKEGAAAAGALLARMEWDGELRGFVPGLEDAYPDGSAAREEASPGDPVDWQDEEGPGGGDGRADGGISSPTEEDGMQEDADSDDEEKAVSDEGPGEGGEPGRPAAGGSPTETRAVMYARVLKKDYLDRKSPGDESGIRRLIERIEEKNGKAFGEARAEEIVDTVLSVWAVDVSIESEKRALIETIREERRSSPEEEYAHGPAIGDSSMMAGDTGEAQADIQETGLSEMTGDGAEPDPIAADASGVIAGLDAEIRGEEGGSRTGQAPDEDSFLIEDPVQSDSGGGKPDAGAGSDEGYLIGQDPIMEIATEGPVIKEAPLPGDADTVESIEVFTIKDEILFQDNPEKRRKTRGERSRKGMRITKIDISGPDES